MSNTIEVRATEIGAGQTAHVTDLFVSTGETVAAEAPLLVLESVKATVEVCSPSAGRIEQLLVTRNSSVVDGDLLMVLQPLEREQPTAPSQALPNEALPSQGIGDRPSPSPAAPSPVARANPTTKVPAHPRSDFHASPWIRGLAWERGIDLSLVEGTGPYGRILEEDLDVKRRVLALPASNSADTGETPSIEQGAGKTKPLSRLQRAVARNLTSNWTHIPHVTQFDESDVTELEAFRVAINVERQKHGLKLSLLPFVVKAAACALQAFPDFNSTLAEDELVVNDRINIGFAVDVEDGLRVPVIHDADRMSVAKIAREIARLAEAARASTLAAGDCKGGTFTISNLGGAGGTAFTPIINAPEVAILGLSKAELKPKWDGNAFIPRLMLPLSLSYDHRVVNGVAGARFTAHISAVLSDLRRAIL